MKLLLAVLALAAFSRVDAAEFVVPFSVRLSELVDLATNGPQVIVVRGLMNGARFDFNLQDEPVQSSSSSNVPLTVSVRSGVGAVVRNTLVQANGQCQTGVNCSVGWRTEQREGVFPFAVGSEFELQIVLESSMFQVFVNGQHFANYIHILQPRFARYIEVSGSVALRSVEVRRLSFNPPGDIPPGPGVTPTPPPVTEDPSNPGNTPIEE